MFEALKYGQFEASNMAIAMGMCCHRDLDSSNGANLQKPMQQAERRREEERRAAEAQKTR